MQMAMCATAWQASRKTVTVLDSGKEGYSKVTQTPLASPFLNTKSFEYGSPESRAGSSDPILRSNSPQVSWQTADKTYMMKKMLDEDRDPEYLEMASLKDGRMGAVPRRVV